MTKELSKSYSNVGDLVFSGRPRNEEPHVKRTTKRRTERVEYIVRVDLAELKLEDDEFENLLGLFKLFDLDKDGILSFIEYEKLLKCLGYRVDKEQARLLASSVSADKASFSVSFNEFLRLMALQRESEPDQETLVQVFASFDKDNLGMIAESTFRKIMSAKDDVDGQDIADMLDEYYRLAHLKGLSTRRPSGARDSPAPPLVPPIHRRPSRAATPAPATAEAAHSDSNGDSDAAAHQLKEERWINYNEFAAMLQQ